MSHAWLVGRAQELSVTSQHSEPEGVRPLVREANTILAEAQRRGEPRVVAQVLRHTAAMRLASPEFVNSAAPLLDELLTHARRHGLVALQSDAHALRGHLALLTSREDEAITEAASGLALIDDASVPDSLMGQRSWDRLMSTALIDLGWALTQLGVYEMADDTMAKAQQRIRESGGPHEITVHMIDRCRMLLGWGFRLERVGQSDDAASRFSTAAAMAAAIETPWRQSLFPRTAHLPAAEQMPVLGAAHALANPGAEHIPTLEYLRSSERTTHPREKIFVAIALSRSMVAADRDVDAARLLSDTYSELRDDASEVTLRISLAREYAWLTEIDANEALLSYADELEHELWMMRQARVTTLLARLDNERLSHQREAMTQQAMQDPLTGLYNRRALDDTLESMVTNSENHPLSVALVDLDGFKEVNDRCSHAEGDDVLRVIASTLRDTLRADDFLARYGGDEFVVLLPGVTLSAAESAMQRAVEAVRALPFALSRGVTLSIGTVTVRPKESGNQVLSRADAAMYRAKDGGGNQVATSGDGSDAD